MTHPCGDMGDSHLRRKSLPWASSIFILRSNNRPSLSLPKYTFQIPSSISSRPTYSPMQVVETLTHCLFQRIPPLALT